MIIHDNDSTPDSDEGKHLPILWWEQNAGRVHRGMCCVIKRRRPLFTRPHHSSPVKVHSIFVSSQPAFRDLIKFPDLINTDHKILMLGLF